MQYFGRAIGTVSRTWNSLNPSTLSGAIDVVVIKQSNGDYRCSAFHIRFGKISLLRPSQKGVDFYVNGEKIDVQMKLGEGGEAFFVFETSADVPENLLTSPVVSPAGSPLASESEIEENADVEFLDISNAVDPPVPDEQQPPSGNEKDDLVESDIDADKLGPILRDQHPENIDKIIKRLREVKIPTTQDDDGSVIMDMTGYKAGGQNTKELEKLVSNLYQMDGQSPLRSPDSSPPGSPKSPSGTSFPATENNSENPNNDSNSDASTGTNDRPQHFVKTLRLSSDILKSLGLKPGKNDMKFVVRSNGATITANIFLWDSITPVVISDIDGTITRSDALGHFMTLVGRDWTHPGVGRLFSDIARNGYNIMYLTSRSVGLAESTRSYLKSIDQNGYKLPAGPVILSPDRTMAALRREVIMRKPEIFKMACLRDIAKLYEYNNEEDMSPFYAGFGNRITDGLSYRSVGVPSTKIFTINTDSEVLLELLELTGIKSSYTLITDLVDQLFPPVLPEQQKLHQLNSVGFSDTNFWKSPLPNLSDEEVDEEANREEFTKEKVGKWKGGSHSSQVNTTSSLTATQRGLDWETNLNATFIEDDYDSEADDYYDDSAEDDEEDEDYDPDQEPLSYDTGSNEATTTHENPKETIRSNVSIDSPQHEDISVTVNTDSLTGSAEKTHLPALKESLLK